MGVPPHSIAIHGKPPTSPPPPTANPNLGRWRFAVDFLDQNNGCKTGAKGSYAKLKTTVYSLKFGFHSFKRRQSPFQAIIVISFFNSQFYVFPDLLSENKLEAFFVRISRSLRFVDVTSRYLRFLASGLANFRSVWSSSPFCDEVASGQVDGQQGPGGQAGGKVSVKISAKILAKITWPGFWPQKCS
jgi:hypothetical protein